MLLERFWHGFSVVLVWIPRIWTAFGMVLVCFGGRLRLAGGHLEDLWGRDKVFLVKQVSSATFCNFVYKENF